MIKKLFALVLIAGVCAAFPHEDDATTNNPLPGPVDSEQSPANPEKGPDDPVQGPFDPEKGPFNAENAIFPTEVPGSIPEDGPKAESDLKTDATFWWPFYRSWSWRYPSYRTYWNYPYYRYYRPRTYY